MLKKHRFAAQLKPFFSAQSLCCCLLIAQSTEWLAARPQALRNEGAIPIFPLPARILFHKRTKTNEKEPDLRLELKQFIDSYFAPRHKNSTSWNFSKDGRDPQSFK